MSLVGGFHSQQYHHSTNISHPSDFITYSHSRGIYNCSEPGNGINGDNGLTSGLSSNGSNVQHGHMTMNNGYINSTSVAWEGSIGTADAYGFTPPPPPNCGDYCGTGSMFGMGMEHGALYVTRGGHRTVKRRGAANRKERRRTLSINTAFSNLRGCIPNVPTDTKLSKIKTLRLATSYISYLMDVLNEDDPTLAEAGFKAELNKKIDREEKRRREAEELAAARAAEKTKNERSTGSSKSRGRTGWPQHVWASELAGGSDSNSTHPHTPSNKISPCSS